MLEHVVNVHANVVMHIILNVKNIYFLEFVKCCKVALVCVCRNCVMRWILNCMPTQISVTLSTGCWREATWLMAPALSTA